MSCIGLVAALLQSIGKPLWFPIDWRTLIPPFLNAPGSCSPCCPHIDLKIILLSNCLANGKIICSQNGQLLQPFCKSQNSSICSQLEHWNLTGPAGERLEALYTFLHPVKLQNCVESQCTRGYKFHLTGCASDIYTMVHLVDGHAVVISAGGLNVV
jgi:hypothetical protein